MLLLAVLLLLSAVGLLIAALVTTQVPLAWGSVGISAVAALALLLRRRRLRRRLRAKPKADVFLEDQPADVEPAERVADTDEPADAGSAGAVPDEEDTDAADLLVVSDLPDEVLVVDEYPRYHLESCSWPDIARAERLPVREARELGFTPCARCSPDAVLARRHRAESTT